MHYPKFKKNENMCLIDLDGFTPIKLELEDKLWLEILETFKSSILDCFEHVTISYVKSLGDGLLITNNSLSPNEWLELSNKINLTLISWKINNSRHYPQLSYSIIFSFGNYYEVSLNDIVGRDIDELFLLERNAPVGETLISYGLFRMLDTETSKKCTSFLTKPIEYLDKKKYKYFTIKY